MDQHETEQPLDKLGHPITRFLRLVNRGAGYSFDPPATRRDLRRAYFGKAAYGDVTRAYQAAVAHRDAAVPTAASDDIEIRAGGHLRRSLYSPSKTTLGRTGLTLFDKIQGYENSETHTHARASGKKPGVRAPVSRTFSVERYGLDTALRYALRCRVAWEREWHGHLSRMTEEGWMRLITLCRKQFRGKARPLDALTHPGQIKTPSDDSYRALIVRKGIRHELLCDRDKYGLAHDAHVAALLWCLAHDESDDGGAQFALWVTPERVAEQPSR